MPSDLQVASRDKRGRILPGNNSRTIKQARIAARLEELRAEYDPAGNASAIDRNRLKLAAMHYIIAETARDPTVSVRSTRARRNIFCPNSSRRLRHAQLRIRQSRR